MSDARRVLVVEDDELLREALTDVLRDEGYEVRSASHGAEALRVLDGWDPGVIVLDLMMPVMDAFEFRRHQRAQGRAVDARVLVLSAARGLDEAAARVEADAFLPKPFRLNEVIDQLERLLTDPREGTPAG